MKTYDYIETGVNVLGIGISLADLQNVLSIVLLIISILSICFRGGLMIYQHIKNKDIDGAIQVSKDTQTEIEDAINKHKKEK